MSEGGFEEEVRKLIEELERRNREKVCEEEERRSFEEEEGLPIILGDIIWEKSESTS